MTGGEGMRKVRLRVGAKKTMAGAEGSGGRGGGAEARGGGGVVTRKGSRLGATAGGVAAGGQAGA